MPLPCRIPGVRCRAGRGYAPLLCLLLLLPSGGQTQTIAPGHGGAEQLPRHTAASSDAVVIPLARQQEQGLRCMVIPEAVAPTALRLPGRISADPDASAVVVAPEAGRLEAPADGFPALGSAVTRGTPLALLRPVLSSAESGDLRAEQAEAQRDVQSTQVQLDQYRLAGQDVRALNQQSASAYSKLRGEHEAATKRLAELGAVQEHRVPLAAALDGRISYSHVDPGRVVNPGDVIFEIIRPERLWVSVLNYDLDQLPAQRAHLTTAQGARLDLELIGMSPALSGQALPLQYKIVGTADGLFVGQPVTVHTQGLSLRHTALLPTASVIDDGHGGHYVWVQQDAEHFLARPVRARRLHGNHAAIEAGLAAGERVVIAGLDLFAGPR